MALMILAWRRPYYLERVLDSWSRALGVSQLRRIVIALGPSDRMQQQYEVVEKAQAKFALPLDVEVQSGAASASPGMHRAYGEGANIIFGYDKDLDFLVFGEEDIIVSDDVLLYMDWCRAEFRNDPGKLIACASGATKDEDADQEAVTSRSDLFSPWVWGTWRGRWESVLEPNWDWDQNSGGPADSGFDHNITNRIMPRFGVSCLYPSASRSQNIGQQEGFYAPSDDEYFLSTQNPSFRASRGKDLQYKYYEPLVDK
jgi:hypothetical protein